MQQSRVNNKYLIIRFNTLLLSHKTSRLAKNRTQVRTASKQHGRLNTDLISLFFSREAWVNIFISLYLRIKQIYLYIFVYARARSIPHTRSERCGLRSSNIQNGFIGGGRDCSLSQGIYLPQSCCVYTRQLFKCILKTQSSVLTINKQYIG